MNRPVEVTFRNTPTIPAIEAVVRRQAAKLERYSRKIVGCRVAVERPQRFQRQGNAYRVRIFVTAASRRPIAVSRDQMTSQTRPEGSASCRTSRAPGEPQHGRGLGPPRARRAT